MPFGAPAAYTALMPQRREPHPNLAVCPNCGDRREVPRYEADAFAARPCPACGSLRRALLLCNSPTRHTGYNRGCLKPTAEGGRCRTHGGNLVPGPANPAWVHGGKSVLGRQLRLGALGGRVAEILEGGTDLRAEFEVQLATLGAVQELAAQELDKEDAEPEAKSRALKAVSAHAQTIGGLSLEAMRIERAEGLSSREVFTLLQSMVTALHTVTASLEARELITAEGRRELLRRIGEFILSVLPGPSSPPPGDDTNDGEC